MLRPHEYPAKFCPTEREPMKRWAALTVLFYLLILVALTVPVTFVLFGNWWGSEESPSLKPGEIFQIYHAGAYWIWLAILVLGQALLLLVPVDVSERRLRARRRLLVPVITTSFFVAILFASAVFSGLCILFNDDAFRVFEFYNQLAGISEQENRSVYTLNNWLTLITVIVVFWAAWGLIFYRFARTDDPNALTKRGARWLLRGSILELLVAVPSHIVVRNRNSCCAPMATFWGIATGIAVMLLCFGPGVFFLFLDRVQRSRPKSPAPVQPND